MNNDSNNYFDLDIQEQPKKRGLFGNKKKKEHKYTQNQNKQLNKSDEYQTKLQLKKRKIRLSKLQIMGLAFIILGLIALIPNKNQNVIDNELEEYIRDITISERGLNITYSTENFGSETLIGKKLINEQDIVQCEYTFIDAEGNTDGIKNYLEIIQQKIKADDSIRMYYNDYIKEVPDCITAYQMTYYKDNYLFINTYWWTEYADTIYNFNINIKFTGNTSQEYWITYNNILKVMLNTITVEE